jgi:hypothetical protein
VQKQDLRIDPATGKQNVDIRGDFDAMRATIEELKNLEDRLRPAKMDISAAIEKEQEHSHQEWVAWAASWNPDVAQPTYEDPGSLDAVGRKGKGKGSKGDRGKGKGKDRTGKGAGTSTSAARPAYDPSKETCICHDCGQAGHIAWYCPLRKNKL